VNNSLAKSIILDNALELFQKNGFQHVSMEDIANYSGIELKDVYREFQSKEDFIFALYYRLAIYLEETLSNIPEGSTSRRFRYLINQKIELLKPYKKLFNDISKQVTKVESRIGIFSLYSEYIRTRVAGVFATCIIGANNSSPPKEYQLLAQTIYFLHLGLIWVWFKLPIFFPLSVVVTTCLISLIQFITSFLQGRRLLKYINKIVAKLGNFSAFDWEDLAEKILLRIFVRRKLVNQESNCIKNPCNICFAPHVIKVQKFIENQEPIHFILPAFPAKSPNHLKVLGKFPDLGEELALKSLQATCAEIKAIYPAGAKLTICSDGHVFSDLVEVPDQDVSDYSSKLKNIIADNQLSDLNVFDLSNLIELTPNYDLLRENLMKSYGDSDEQIKLKISTQPNQQLLFNGIHRFIFEDRCVLHGQNSNSKNRKESKHITYQVIARSNAWSRFLAEQFPNALRLSIHPQVAHSEKIGIKLCHAADNWITPWHGAIFLNNENFKLVKRSEAESLGATVIESKGYPSHLKII
jgi:pyoverdine/dityrosine biosynthesis protein Dit1/AcrR family transcriptional regulator